jgi:hypothetical protein
MIQLITISCILLTGKCRKPRAAAIILLRIIIFLKPGLLKRNLADLGNHGITIQKNDS